jgi:membrane protein
MLLSFTLIMAGPELAEPVARWFGLGRVWAVTWKIVQWPLVLVLIGVAFSFVYYAAPSGVRRGAALWPGAALATVTWLLASLGFRWYVQYFGDYNETYGTIAGAIIALLWLYLSGLCLLVGAELNSEIDNARASAARPVPPART